MTLVEPRSVTRHSRRHVLAWAAGATLAVTTTRFTAVARQATPDATTASATAFLDPGAIHEIAVSFDQDSYDAMVETFTNTGAKEWIEASVTIDGATYDQAGMRLKGNSSLGGIIGGKRDAPTDEAFPATPVAGAEGSGEGPSFDTEGEPGGGLESSTPELLPWLIRLDKVVDGQNHQGITDLVIRSNRSATSLNEAVSLDLLGMAGLASQDAAYTRFTANESDPALRLAIELPNDAWMAAHFSADGLLYKAEAGGDWSYRGDDPESYNDVFDLEAGGTGDDAADFQPLFDFLAFINDSDDDTFAAEIADRLDLDGFVTYRAMMDLIGNFDDISGPGNNAYLYVGPDSPRFTVVPWDMNLAFGGPMMNEAGAGGPFAMINGTPVAPEDVITFPDDASGGSFVIEGTPSADPGGEEQRQVGPGLSNILVERCEALDGFTDRVEQERLRLHADLYASGTAGGVLDQWVALLQDGAADLVDDATIATESAAIADTFAQEP